MYEDESVIAFLDAAPLHHGHTLIVPKVHYPTLDKLPPQWAMACMSVLSQVSRALSAVGDTQAFNVFSNNGKEAGQGMCLALANPFTCRLGWF